MKDTKITKEEAIKELEDSISSIMFTNDVIAFINRIESNESEAIKEEIADQIMSNIDRLFDSYDPTDDICNESFEIDGNRVYLSSCEVDLSDLRHKIQSILSEHSK